MCIDQRKGLNMRSRFAIRSSSLTALAASAFALCCSLPLGAHAAAVVHVMPSPEVQLVAGAISGDRTTSGTHPINVFRGIPYAAPPVANNRWREPQPLAAWAGVREAKQFGPRCMQLEAPMRFRSQRMSEDCLYLNVWAPAATQTGKLPVLVYFHGGGFAFGDGSEPRYDGAHLASRSMIVVTVNYRLGAFGFMMHPDASRDSGTGAAGNYGLLDQQAALRWVRENIERFGGDAKRVTIGGETTGAMAVSAHMAAPSSRGLFAGAIGESGGAFAPNGFWKREKAQRVAQGFATRVGADSLDAMRSISAEKLHEAMGTYKNPQPFFWPSVDGHFLTDSPAAVFEAGGQAPVPLLVGSNSEESHFRTVQGPLAPTPENWTIILSAVFGSELAEARRFYPGSDAADITRSASLLANDLTMSHSTWRWMDLHRQTGRAPVYFYLFTRPRPPAVAAANPEIEADNSAPSTGAPHRSEIPYVFGNLDMDSRYRWTKDDREVSRIFTRYVAQFIKTGNPNGINDRQSMFTTLGRVASARALPNWPAAKVERDGLTRQVIDVDTHTMWDAGAERQALVERIMARRPGS
jgi:para-nitrobenzyl esterase